MHPIHECSHTCAHTNMAVYKLIRNYVLGILKSRKHNEERIPSVLSFTLIERDCRGTRRLLLYARRTFAAYTGAWALFFFFYLQEEKLNGAEGEWLWGTDLSLCSLCWVQSLQKQEDLLAMLLLKGWTSKIRIEFWQMDSKTRESGRKIIKRCDKRESLCQKPVLGKWKLKPMFTRFSFVSSFL